MLMTSSSLAIPLLKFLILSLLSTKLLNSRIWELPLIFWAFKFCLPNLVSLCANPNMHLMFFIDLRWRILSPLKLHAAPTLVLLLLMGLLYLILLSTGVWWVPSSI